MYGVKPTLGAAVVLPATGSNRPLFIAAATLFVGGLVAMAVSKLVAHKG